MPALQAAVVDPILSAISTKLVPMGYISEKILTRAKARVTTGKIGTYGKEALRIVNTASGGRSPYPRVEVSTQSTTTYTLENHGLSTLLTEDDFDNTIMPFEARKDATQDLTTMLWNAKEFALATTMTTLATYASTHRATLSGTDQWSDYTNSDPLANFKTARATVRGTMGVYPNKVVLGPTVFEQLRTHPDLLEVGYKYNRSGQLTHAELEKIFEIPAGGLMVGEAVYNSANEGQTDSIADIWGKHCIFLYAPNEGSRRMQTFGFNVQKAGRTPRRVMRNKIANPPGSEEVMVDDNYDMLITDNTGAYFYKDAVA